MIEFILGLVWWLIGLFFPAKDARDKEREAGEKLGKAETENANAKASLDEVQKAVVARDAERDADAADPGRLHDGSAPGSRPFVDKPD